MKKILCLILFLNLSLSAFAVDLNWSLDGTATGSGYNTDVPANIKDDDEDTGCGLGGYCPQEVSSCNFGIYTLEIEFAESVNTINKIVLIHAATGSVNVASCDIYLYYSGAWNKVWDDIQTGAWAKRTDTKEETWNDITKIKIEVGNITVGPLTSGGHLTYELRAWGPPNYTDIGLRIRTSSATIKIGVKDLEASHKLRIRKGNITYGIPLLATNDSDASGVRIYDGSAVKALPKVD